MRTSASLLSLQTHQRHQADSSSGSPRTIARVNWKGSCSARNPKVVIGGFPRESEPSNQKTFKRTQSSNLVTDLQEHRKVLIF